MAAVPLQQMNLDPVWNRVGVLAKDAGKTLRPGRRFGRRGGGLANGPARGIRLAGAGAAQSLDPVGERIAALRNLVGQANTETFFNTHEQFDALQAAEPQIAIQRRF